jgi:hypothetical protein
MVEDPGISGDLATASIAAIIHGARNRPGSILALLFIHPLIVRRRRRYAAGRHKAALARATGHYESENGGNGNDGFAHGFLSFTKSK